MVVIGVIASTIAAIYASLAFYFVVTDATIDFLGRLMIAVELIAAMTSAMIFWWLLLGVCS